MSNTVNSNASSPSLRTISDMNPLVSVVIPAFNSAEFIIEAINSVLEQTYQPIEIIIVDDGSQDNTVELIKSTFKNDVRLFRQQNSGPSASRNHGVRESSGKYVAFLDADDIWLPDKIANQLAVMEDNPDIGLLCGNMIDFNEGGRDAQSHFEKNGLDENFFGDELYITNPFQKIYQKNFISTPTVVLRRSILEKTELFPLEFRFSEDYLFWLDLARIDNVAYQPEVYTLRRKHKTNLTNDIAINVLIRPTFLDHINKKHGEYLKEQGIDIRVRYSKAWFEIGYFRLYQLGQTDVVTDFIKSFNYQPNWRSCFYACATAIGLGRVAIKLKQYREIKN